VAIKVVDALNMLLASVLVFLFLRQILPLAAGLAGGVSLSTLGTLSGGMRSAHAALRERRREKQRQSNADVISSRLDAVLAKHSPRFPG
jgi:hypothetical protein